VRVALNIEPLTLVRQPLNLFGGDVYVVIRGR